MPYFKIKTITIYTTNPEKEIYLLILTTDDITKVTKGYWLLSTESSNL